MSGPLPRNSFLSGNTASTSAMGTSTPNPALSSAHPISEKILSRDIEIVPTVTPKIGYKDGFMVITLDLISRVPQTTPFRQMTCVVVKSVGPEIELSYDISNKEICLNPHGTLSFRIDPCAAHVVRKITLDDKGVDGALVKRGGNWAIVSNKALYHL